MPDRELLYRIGKGYDMASHSEYMMSVYIERVLSESVKEDAIEVYNNIPDDIKKLIEDKL